MNSIRRATPDPARDSRLATASVALGALSWSVGTVLLVVSFVTEAGTYAERQSTNLLLVFGLFVAPVLHLVGLGLGFAAIVKRSSRKGVAVTGMVINGVPLVLGLVAWILVVILGVAVVTSGGGWR